VYGPGTGTSDSIPAWLSNGEWVIKAASVAKYGPAFMSALNSGTLPRYAAGGPVVQQYTTGPVSAPRATASASSAAQQPMVSIGSLVTADPRAAVHEVSALVALQMAGRVK